MSEPQSPHPSLRASLTGARGALTLWLPLLLLALTTAWWAREGAVPVGWAAPAVTAAGALLGDPVVRAVLGLARDTEAADRRRRRLVADPRVAIEAARQRSEATEAETVEAPEPPLRGGLVIGVLERLAVTLCLIGAFPAGIAVVVAIKGLARYGEFTNASQREQFIIGTLASLLWAAGAAGLIALTTGAVAV